MEHYLRDAIRSRISRRAFERLPLRKQDADAIKRLIEKFNNEAKLKMSLVEIDEDLFSAKGGAFRDVVNYIAMVGTRADNALEDKVGYYGELLVLEATALSLGTCWITKTFDREACEKSLEIDGEDEILVAIVAIGYPLQKMTIRESVLSRFNHLRDKKAKDILISRTQAPSWVQDGINAVLRAPSFANQLPVKFTYTSEGKVVADVDSAKRERRIDLGISLVHFEIGAAVGRWYKEGGIWTYVVTQKQQIS
jgi:hypothetical protein